MSKIPKVVVLCGSSRFIDVMAVCAWLLERDEGAIALSLHLLPQWYAEDLVDDHLAEAEGVAEQMDELHLRKLEICDEVFVVDCGGYVGESTSREIAYAQKLGLPIRRFTTDELGTTVGELLNAAIARNGGRDDQ